ncbi:MAG TPA: T9SS type A sorting domain-containing protein [Saprospiraceae bacterium]|nr:T9SS type A sorting domain-containing protein [Saprospiraceae bacterium]HMP25872.1 T9SS type A sorting domain-containing protein [Saprospiraceae bacterium]
MKDQVNAASSADLVVRLQDISGRLIRSENYRVAPGASTLQFNPGSVAAGLYLLNFTSDEGSTVRRIVIR